MPNSETGHETVCKQPTGSSKRKRKQSIKRNIVNDEEDTCNESLTVSRSDKFHGKRSKSAKVKPGKEPTEGCLKGDNKSNKVSCVEDVKDTNYDPSHVSNCEEKCDKPKLNTKDSEVVKCTSSKEQCQNCKFCSEHNTAKQELEDPGNNKKTKKKFPCEICAKEGSPKVYNTIEKHKQHMATVHEIYGKEVKRFECTECPQTVWFPTKSKFTYHLGTKHPGIIKFICEVCTETFKLKANYKNHMKTHNIVVQKKFSCDVCNGTFVNKAGYEAHKRRFPGPHIKQSCSHCGFSFSREKHLINHRCKTLLLEEAARANSNNSVEAVKIVPSAEELVKVVPENSDNKCDDTPILEKKLTEETPEDSDPSQKKPTEGDVQGNKRVVLHRIIPRKNQDQTVYRSVQMPTQNVPESVVVQELREIDLENGTFIAATSSGDPEQQFIVRDINGQLVQGGHIFQLDINDVQPGEESQVYLADWNIVAPYVIREKSP